MVYITNYLLVKGLIITTGLLLYGFALYRDLVKRLKIEKAKSKIYKNGKTKNRQTGGENVVINKLVKQGYTLEVAKKIANNVNGVVSLNDNNGVGYAKRGL